MGFNYGKSDSKSDSKGAGFNMSMSNQSSSSQGNSRPTTPAELTAYYKALGELAPGLMEGVTAGTPVMYEGLSMDQLRSLGGAGATRKADALAARDSALKEIVSNPSLTTFQSARSKQTVNEDAAKKLDTIAKETEAILTALASEEAKRNYMAGVGNREMNRDDLELLSKIFFGGAGTYSQSSARSAASSSGYGEWANDASSKSKSRSIGISV